MQEVRRDLWRQHNSLKKTRPLIYVRAFAWGEMPQARCLCQDPFYRTYEDLLRYNLFWYSLGDDSVFEPWITVNAVKTCIGWGVESTRRMPDEERGAFKYDYAIKELDDVNKLRKPWHGIDEEQTQENVRKLEDAIGDILTVDCDRSPHNYTHWADRRPRQAARHRTPHAGHGGSPGMAARVGAVYGGWRRRRCMTRPKLPATGA